MEWNKLDADRLVGFGAAEYVKDEPKPVVNLEFDAPLEDIPGLTDYVEKRFPVEYKEEKRPYQTKEEKTVPTTKKKPGRKVNKK